MRSKLYQDRTLLYYPLYQETGSEQESNNQWYPEPRPWIGGVIVFSVIGSVLFLNPMTHYIAGLSLTRTPECETDTDRG